MLNPRDFMTQPNQHTSCFSNITTKYLYGNTKQPISQQVSTIIQIIQQESISLHKPELTNPFKFREQSTVWWRHFRAILWLTICMQHCTIGSWASQLKQFPPFVLRCRNVLIVWYCKTRNGLARYGTTGRVPLSQFSLFFITHFNRTSRLAGEVFYWMQTFSYPLLS